MVTDLLQCLALLACPFQLCSYEAYFKCTSISWTVPCWSWSAHSPGCLLSGSMSPCHPLCLHVDVILLSLIVITHKYSIEKTQYFYFFILLYENKQYPHYNSQSIFRNSSTCCGSCMYNWGFHSEQMCSNFLAWFPPPVCGLLVCVGGREASYPFTIGSRGKRQGEKREKFKLGRARKSMALELPMSRAVFDMWSKSEGGPLASARAK